MSTSFLQKEAESRGAASGGEGTRGVEASSGFLASNGGLGRMVESLTAGATYVGGSRERTKICV